MRITKPNGPAGVMGNKSPARPDWFAEWLSKQGKWVLLNCGCIQDVHLPHCVTLLTGKDIYIECPTYIRYDPHGFQKIKKTLTFREYLKARGYSFPEPDGLFPPF